MCPGKTQLIADALSRAPVFPPEEEKDILVCTVHAVRATNDEALKDPALEHLIKLSQEDQEYQSIYKTFKAHKELHKLPKGHPAPQWKMYWDALSTEPEMPGLILYQHCGETKTLQLARSLYFWPGMTRAIKNKVSHCSECLELRPSRPSEPFIQTLNVSRPFEAISIDLGYLKGDHYLVMVDRYSGWPKVQKMTKLDTKAVTEVLKTWFMQHGIPNRIRSDFGPQFHGEFQS